MNQYARIVIEAAARYQGDLPDFHWNAYRSLKSYFVYPQTERNQQLPLLSPAAADQWYKNMSQAVRRMVEEAWSQPAMREHVRQLAALNRLADALYYKVEPWPEYMKFYADTGNELGLWPWWPQLHDIQRLVPISPQTQSAATTDAQQRQFVHTHHQLHAEVQSFQVQQAAQAAAWAWNNDWMNKW